MSGTSLHACECTCYCYQVSPRKEATELYLFIYYLVCEPIGTTATPGLLCQPRVTVKMIVEKQMECRLAGETEVLLGVNLPQRPLLSITKSHMTRPRFEPRLPRWEAGD
jgi:hypothetical protein